LFYLFPIFSMNSLPCGYRFSTFISTSCEAPSKWINSIFVFRTLIRFAFLLAELFSAAFQRGAKLRSFFNLPKVF